MVVITSSIVVSQNKAPSKEGVLFWLRRLGLSQRQHLRSKSVVAGSVEPEHAQMLASSMFRRKRTKSAIQSPEPSNTLLKKKRRLWVNSVPYASFTALLCRKQDKKKRHGWYNTVTRVPYLPKYYQNSYNMSIIFWVLVMILRCLMLWASVRI